MPLSTELVLALLSALGAIATAGVKGVWVWGRELRQCREDCARRDQDIGFWRDLALRSVGLTDVAIKVAEKKSGDG